MTSNYR